MIKKSGTYHHGDLRSCILDAGLKLLEEKGVSGLSLRAVAKIAGVSPAAPTHHFGNITGIYSSIAAIGFDRMMARIESIKTEEPDKNSIQQLAIGYLKYTKENPSLFKLMFDCEKLNWEQPDLADASERSIIGFKEMIYQKTHLAHLNQSFSSEITVPEMLATWGIIHGFAHLIIENQISYFMDADNEMDFATRGLESILELIIKKP